MIRFQNLFSNYFEFMIFVEAEDDYLTGRMLPLQVREMK